MAKINLENSQNTNKKLAKKLDEKSKLYCESNLVFAKNMSTLLQDILHSKLEQLIHEKTKSVLEDQVLSLADLGISKLLNQTPDVDFEHDKKYSDIDYLEKRLKSIIGLVPTLSTDDLHKLFDIIQSKPLESTLEFVQKNASGKIFIGSIDLKSNYLHTS